MPEEKKTVDLDTSGPGADIDIEETKDETVIDTEAPKQETETNETDKTFENERETKLDEKKDDDKLEEYSKGVQSRIAKLTRKMREAERREKAAVEYAQAVEQKRQALENDRYRLLGTYIIRIGCVNYTRSPEASRIGKNTWNPPAACTSNNSKN